MNRKYCPYCMTPVPEGESCSVCGLTSGTYVPSPHHLPPGTILMDRYLVGRVLGEGGFGITYIGRDLRLELKVAIKEYYPVDRATRNASASLEVTNFIGPSAKSFERGKQKFLGEAQVMAKMDKQQAIVSVRDFFEINNTAYIVMEYIEGITFRELVEKKGGKILPEELFPMLEPLFHALSTMHENGLIHRDISPDNLMLENGKVRLLDFGCAREASRGVETMTIALKHGYAPIEQYQQKGQGPWTDIYALSATIYYCLTGKVPPQALDRIADDELLLPSKLGVQISAEQEKALLKGMKLQPNRRFSSAEEMWGALYAPLEEGGKVRKNVRDGKADAARGQVEEHDGFSSDLAGKTAGQFQLSTRGAGSEEQEPDKIFRKETAWPETGTMKAAHVENTAGQQDKRKKILAAAGIGAACIIMFFSVWASHKKEQGGADGIQENISAGKSVTETDDMGNVANGNDSDDKMEVDPHLFDNAHAFTSGEREEFQKLMEDDSVTAISIECDRVDVKEAEITKPVLVAKGADWKPDKLVVTENGYLQVEGCLDMSSCGQMRLLGNKLRFFVVDGGEFRSENALVWMDHGDCLATENDEEISAHKLIFSDDIFDEGSVVSVTDMKSLQRAAESGRAVSIDKDMTLTDFVAVCTPVRISEGVTLDTSSNGNGNDSFGFSLEEGGILVNNGTLRGNLYARENSTVINNGLFTKMNTNEFISGTFWFQDEGALINQGTMDLYYASRFWDDSLCFNQGEMNCYDFYLCGGHMANSGSMVLPDIAAMPVPDRIPYFSIFGGSRLWNKESAYITILGGAEFVNNGWITNQGNLIVESNGGFSNAVLENNGNFQIKSGGRVDRDRSGIYFGTGVFEVGEEDEIHVYHTSYDDPDGMAQTAEAATAEELEKALENPDVKTVLVKADITVGKELTIRKNLVIDSGTSLTMVEGAAMTDYGGVIVLKEGASLYGKRIMLSEDARINMEYGSELLIEESGSLTLDGSLLQGRGGSIQMKGAEFVLKNQAGFAFDLLSSIEASGCKMSVQDASVFVTPYDNGISLGGAEITLANGYFYTASDTALEDCSLDIAQGVFRNSAEKLDLKNCTVSIGGSGEMLSDCANLSVLSGTTVENRGRLKVAGWHEYELTLHGTITNYGDMEMNIVHEEPDEPINNQGNLYYSESHYASSEYYQKHPHDWNDCVAGNKPIDLDTQ